MINLFKLKIWYPLLVLFYAAFPGLHYNPNCIFKHNNRFMRLKELHQSLKVYWSIKKKTHCKYTATFIKWQDFHEKTAIYVCSDNQTRILPLNRLVLD